MFVAVDLFIVLEDTLTGASTHEVIVALTRCQAATHSGTRLVATLTSLKRIKVNNTNILVSAGWTSFTGSVSK